jgi:pSer/pThr/pTyr-binding forkhead associated (FHA) protein
MVKVLRLATAENGGGQYVLRFIHGPFTGKSFRVPLDRPIALGRGDDLDLVLDEERVSKEHARIEMRVDRLWIEDLGSTNGTFVNGEKIACATRLAERDRVLIGTSVFVLIWSH